MMNLAPSAGEPGALAADQAPVARTLPGEGGEVGGRRLRIRLAPLLRLLVSAGLIYLILRRVELGEVWAVVSRSDVRILSGAFLLNFVGYLLTAGRWRVLLDASGIRAPLRYLVESCMIAMFFNNFLPSTVGGDAVRAYDSWRLGRSKASALAVIMVDRLLGTLVMLLLACATLLLFARVLDADLAALRWIVLGMTGAGLLVAWLVFLPPRWLLLALGRIDWPGVPLVRRVVESGLAAFAGFRGRGDALARALAFSVALQLNVIVQYYLVAQALSIPIALPLFFVIIPIALLVMALPVSINAIGIREGIFAFLFGLQGVASATAVAFAWLIYGIVLVHGLLGGVLYAIRREPRLPHQTRM